MIEEERLEPMTWKKIVNAGSRLAEIVPEHKDDQPHLKNMRLDPDEKEYIVVPTKIPTEVPKSTPAPVKEPAKTPVKEPAKTAGHQIIREHKDDPHLKNMRLDPDEKEYIVKPTTVPTSVPVKEPVKEPAKTPAPVKEPAKTGGWKGVIGMSQGDQIDMSDKPTTVNGEFLGYRRMKVKKDEEGKWAFHSPQQTEVWSPGPKRAGCKNNPDHTPASDHLESDRSKAPVEGCMCGLYATWDEPHLNQEYSGEHDWTAQVKAWGRVRSGEQRPQVMRSEFMQINGIRPPKCEQCDEPATHIITANQTALSGRPTCEKHKPPFVVEKNTGEQRGILAQNVSEIAQHLSNYYGGAEIRNRGEEWSGASAGSDDEDMSEFEKMMKGSSLDTTGSLGWARVGYTFPKKG